MKGCRKLGAHNAGYPPNDENLPSGELLGPILVGDRLLDHADRNAQRDVRGGSGTKTSDGGQVKRALRIRQARVELFQPRLEELGSLAIAIRVGVLGHEQKEQLRVPGRAVAVDLLEISELRPGYP